MIPISLGVTGHRDIRDEDMPSLRAAIRQRLEKLLTEFPHSDFNLYNGLATGADSLFFDVASTFDRIKITAVLPFAEDEYRVDFVTLEETQGFDARLELANKILNASEGLVLRRRNDGYVNVGQLIVERAQILFCLWDGTGASKPQPGGTAHVFQMAKHGVKNHNSVTGGERAQIEHLFALRQSNAPDFIEENHNNIATWNLPVIDENMLIALKQIDEFNRRSKKVSATAISKSISYLYDGKPKPQDCSSHEVLEHTYACADVMASQHQSWRKTGILLVSMFGFFAVVSMQIFQSFGHANFWIASYFALSLLGIGIYVLLFRGPASHEKNLLEWRSLAECLRVQNFWNLCGVKEKVSDYYLTDDASESAWLRTAIKAVEPTEPKVGDPTMLVFVAQVWIRGQFKYFSKQAKANLGLEARYNKLIVVSLGLGLLATLVLTVAHFNIWDIAWVNLSGFLSGMFFLVAASLKAFTSYMGFSILGNKYYYSALVMEAATDKLTALSKSGEVDECRSVFKEAGKFALSENSHWLRSHRERQFEMIIS